MSRRSNTGLFYIAKLLSESLKTITGIFKWNLPGICRVLLEFGVAGGEMLQ